MSFVVGTAGHIDHGKSTLITALTGIDPDRLAEEKRRGMTIDLGFAHMTLPSGREIGLVDVPGHARFMRNMLAGAHGLDAVLLVVASDEGVMPQTREHLDVIDLLDVRSGIVVLTKVDLVDGDWLSLVKEEVRAAVKGTSLEKAAMVAVSSVSGEGLPELVATLDAMLETSAARVDSGRPRLPIDRVFTMSGFGTVVTGTLADGSISLGAEMVVHTGTVEVGCRVIVLDGDEIAPGGEGWVQLYLARAIAAAAGDRFVLRVPSPAMTVAGGGFVDVAPRKHPRHDSAVRESLARRASGNVLQEELRKYPRGVAVSALLKASVAPQSDIDTLDARRLGDWIFSDDAWRSIATRASQELETYHGAYPFRPGMAREELRSRLGVPAPSFPAVVRGLLEDGLVVERNGSLAAPGHLVTIEADGSAMNLVRLLEVQKFAPASLADAMQQTGADDETVRALAQRGDIVRVSDDVAFSRDAYESAVARGNEIVAANGSVTGAQLRHRTSANRRPVLALLGHLDSQRVTRRVGDARTLR